MKKHNDWVWYADKPGGEPRKVKKDVIAKQHDFTWSEEFVFPEGTEPGVIEKYYQGVEDFIRTKFGDVHLSEIEDKLVLCDMGECGLGLFAREDIEPGILCIYTGTFTEDISDVDYLFSKLENVDHCINSKHHGNIARFVQHAPSLGNFELEFSADAEEILSLGNTDHELFLVPGTHFMLVIFYNALTIFKGFIAKDYGLSYWNEKGREPTYFNKDVMPYIGKPLCKPSEPRIDKLGSFLMLFFPNLDYIISIAVPTPDLQSLKDVYRSEDINIIKAFAAAMMPESYQSDLQKVWNVEA